MSELTNADLLNLSEKMIVDAAEAGTAEGAQAAMISSLAASTLIIARSHVHVAVEQSFEYKAGYDQARRDYL